MITIVKPQYKTVQRPSRSVAGEICFDSQWSGVPIVRPKDKVFMHHGVILGYSCNGYGFKTYWVLESVASQGFRVVTLDLFCSGEDCFIRATPARLSQAEIMQRCYAALRDPLPYHLISANCEHLVSWIVDGEFKSRQVNGAMLVGTVVLGIAGVVFLGGDS